MENTVCKLVSIFCLYFLLCRDKIETLAASQTYHHRTEHDHRFPAMIGDFPSDGELKYIFLH